MVVFNVKKFEKYVESTLGILQIFIILVEFIAFSFSFFLLIISITSNIKEHMQELGVLRAIGLRKAQILKIYRACSCGIFFALTFFCLLSKQLLSWLLFQPGQEEYSLESNCPGQNSSQHRSYFKRKAKECYCNEDATTTSPVYV